MEYEFDVVGPELRRLKNAWTIAMGVYACVMSLYRYAKNKHSILMFPARILEIPVTIVLGFLRNRFPNWSHSLWIIADNLVDEVIAPTIYAYTPEFVRNVVRPYRDCARRAKFKALMAAEMAKAGNPKSAAHFVYIELQRCIARLIAKVWVYLNKYGLFRALAIRMHPSAWHFSMEYNRFISYYAWMGYPLFGYLPAIPIFDLAMAVYMESK